MAGTQQGGTKTAKKTAKKSTAKRTTAKASSSRSRSQDSEEEPRRPTAVRIASTAASDLLALTGKQAESVVGLRRTEDGWAVQVEVVEMRRIPDSTDVLALYEVDADEDGALTGYRRLRRYVRGNPQAEA